MAAAKLIAVDFKTATSLGDGKANAIMSPIFISLEKDGLNIIATEKTKFFDDFQLATRVAMKLGLNEKSQRITLFQAILYGNW